MSEALPVAITISRQYGSGGADLGQRLAAKLGAAYLDKEILRMASERMGAKDADLSRWDERIPPFWERFIRTLSVGPAESISPGPDEPPDVPEEVLFRVEERVIREAAARRSVVVIGRAGGWVLRDHPRLIRVYLHAPLAMRLPVIMKRLNLATAAEARKLIDRIDAERQRFIHKATGGFVGESHNYDLCLNMAHVGLDFAEDILLRDVERLRASSSSSGM